MTTKDISIQIRRSGPCGFDMVVFAGNPQDQLEATRMLDAILFKEAWNETIIAKTKHPRWLSAAYSWTWGFDIGVSRMFMTGEVKEAQRVLNEWLKKCVAVFGKNLSVENGAK